MILVTGSTGRVGEQVVRTLRKLKLDVRCLVRKGSEYFWLNDTGCNYFFGDLRDELSIRRATRDVKYLIVCSGIRQESRENNHSTVTIEGHKTLFALAKERGIERVVMLSCMGTDNDYSIPSFYARKQAEDLLINSGLEYTILRSGLHEQHFLEMALKGSEKGSINLPGEGNNALNPVATRDLALMMISSLDLDSAKNQIINVGGATQMSAREAFDKACAAGDLDLSVKVLPSAALAIGSRIGRPLRRYANQLNEMSIWFKTDFTVDAKSLEKQFNISFTPLEKAMKSSVQIMKIRRDPDLREKHMVHPQFYATIYEPGTAKLSDMPQGPEPRRD